MQETGCNKAVVLLTIVNQVRIHHKTSDDILFAKGNPTNHNGNANKDGGDGKRAIHERVLAYKLITDLLFVLLFYTKRIDRGGAIGIVWM